MEFSRIGPVTGVVASTSRAMQASEVSEIAKKAAEAALAWAELGPNARRTVLLNAAAEIQSRSESFTAAMVAEIGATKAWAIFNVALAASMVREAAALTTQIAGEVIPSDKPGCVAMVMREPVGVVLGIAPWNAPIILGVRAIAVPLACGNAVILKASEQCPRTHSLIVEAFAAAGFPQSVVNIVTNAPADAASVVGALIDAPEVKRINFTGSTDVGRIIAKRAAEHLKPCLLELGGKAPLLVLEDADLDEAVKAAAFGAFMNQGQICMSTERIIVVEAIAEQFVEKFTAKVSTMAVGDPCNGSAPLGAVADVKTVEHCYSLVADAVEQGGRLLTGGNTEQAVLMPPHVVDGVTPQMRLFREESFGPVVGIVHAADEDHAVALANDTEYGLSAAVFTRDTARGLRIARRIKSGICHVNGPTVHDEAQMPFGGVGASGYGRFGGKAGIDSFTEQRWITLETQPGHFPI